MIRPATPLALLLTVLIGTQIIGCAAERFDDPVGAMTDPEVGDAGAMRAMREASKSAPDDPNRIQGLKSILSAPGYSLAMRREALELLLEHDEEDARTTLLYRLPSLSSWDFVEYVSMRIADEGWTEFVPSLVRSLARPMPTFELNDRPELQAIQDLYPDRDVRDVIFDFVSEPTTNPVFVRWRLAGWEVLNKLGDSYPWRDRLLTLDTTDPFLSDIRLAARDLGVIARTQEELKWLQTLREPQYSEWWSRAREAIAGLNEDQRYGIALRHIPVILQTLDHFPQWMELTAGDFRTRLEARIGPRRHIELPRDSSSYRPQDLESSLPRMAWGDLLALHLVDHMLQDHELQATLFAQAEQDQKDPTTEYGGVLEMTPSGPVAEMFVPRRRENDLKFYASTAMVVRGYTAPFHYHFHVQERDNRDFAGPGLGDLEYADALGVNAIVLTSVGRDAMNCDFYGPDDIIVDLGVMRK